MPRLECGRCGLSYHSATLPQYLLSATGASCPRCGTTLSRPNRDQDARARPPATPAHHRVAVTQSLSWAEQAAAEGDYSGALSWLATIEAIDGELPSGVDAKRRTWAARARATAER
jgi:hypothetical protein